MLEQPQGLGVAATSPTVIEARSHLAATSWHTPLAVEGGVDISVHAAAGSLPTTPRSPAAVRELFLQIPDPANLVEAVVEI